MVYKRAHYRRRVTHLLCALPPPQTEARDGTSTIHSHYFELYMEHICEHKKDKRSCIVNMELPDTETQKQIAQKFDLILNTYPIEDAPSLRAALLKMLITDDKAIPRMMDILNTYAMSIVMISQLVHEIGLS